MLGFKMDYPVSRIQDPAPGRIVYVWDKNVKVFPFIGGGS
jgi:hypothetical protein